MALIKEEVSFLNGTFQLHLQNGGGATNPAGLPPGILLQKCKSNPIPPSRD